MKRAIVIILIMILVAGGGAGGLIMLGIVPNPFNPKMPERPLTAAVKAAAEREEQNKFKPPLAAFPLVRMSDMVIPVIINGQSQRRVFLIARLMATTPADEGYLELHMGRYQDALLRDLVPYFQNFFLDHDMMDILEVKRRMTKSAKTIFGDHVQEILLTNAFEQGASRLR